MIFQEIAFLHSKASYHTVFHKNGGRGGSNRTTTCLRTVDGGKQAHALCNILSHQHFLFFASVEFCGDHKTATNFW